jgi:hypothetical protein
MKQLLASLVILVSASVAAAQPAARPAGDTALLPGDAAVTGWKKADNLRVFTSADLYGYIDGGAEVFLELGFEQLTLQKYRGGTNEFAVEIYRMTDPTAATGLFLMKRGKEVRDARFGGRHTINRHQLMFVRDRFYVTINNLSGADGMQAELVRFGGQVVSKIASDRVPADLAALPPGGLVAGSERLVRGEFGLQAIYTLGDGDILQLGRRVTAVAGDYKDASGSYTRILVPYPDAASAKKALAFLQKNLDKYLKPVSPAADRLVFRDYDNKFGLASLSGRTLDIRLHLAKQPQMP